MFKTVRIAALGLGTIASLMASPPLALAVVKIAASTTDLGSIAKSVGGDRVDVVAIARPNGDPHRVEVLPSYMVRVARAQVYLKVGLGLDQWADAIIEGSHNGKLLVVNCSNGVNVLEMPTGKVDASMGDVHPDGNPHYWLDPNNAAIVARNIAAEIGKVDPGNAAEYSNRAEEFAQAALALAATGVEVVKKLPSKEMITYHRSWTYFANAFGLQVVQTIEPIPGIPPTARHLQEVVHLIKQRRVPFVLEETYFSEEGGEFLNRQTGIRIERIAASCDNTSAGSYLTHLQTVLNQLAGAR
jgi:ABC-type Zn uptake system ZnuABC Zn-binding protein ZnuA